MPDDNPNPTPAPAATPPADNKAQHRSQVRAIARSAGLDTEWADAQIDADADLVAVRAAAFDEMQQRNAPAFRVHQAGPSGDDPAVILQRRTDALAARVMGTTPDDAARPYYNDRMADHARAFLVMRGESVAGLSGETILMRAAHSTSDFPQLLQGVGNRALLSSYQAAQSPLKMIARKATLPDFRSRSVLRLGEVGQLGEVSESGEITSTTRGEVVEGYALKTFGRIFSLTRPALVNDDLSAFTDWGIAAGRAAAETEAMVLVDLLTSNSGAGPVMSDGENLFDEAHGNLAAVGTPPLDSTEYGVDITPLSNARFALRTMKGLDGTTPISVPPKFLLVGADLETVAEQALAQLAATTAGDVNPFAGKLELLVEPRISTQWYVAADPAVLPCFEWAYLAGGEGPQISSRMGFEVLATEFRVYLDFGAGAIDWRGLYRNPGE